MFKRLLVALDGSVRAEQAIPFAARLARVAGGSILFLRVVDSLHELGIYTALSGVYLQDMLEKDRASATAYLEGITSLRELADIEKRSMVVSGLPASTILDVIQSENIDAVVLCSHGYTGFKRWTLGSVAQKVARLSTVPLVLLREGHTQLRERLGSSARILVALDGSSFAEAALLPAAQLAKSLSVPEEGEVHLFHLTHRPTYDDEQTYRHLGFDVNLRDAIHEKAEVYLQSLRGTILAAVPGVDVTCAAEESDDVADGLLEHAAFVDEPGGQPAYDLLALTTHGRSGLQRWMLGSVTERVLAGSTLPLLIVHPTRTS